MAFKPAYLKAYDTQPALKKSKMENIKNPKPKGELGGLLMINIILLSYEKSSFFITITCTFLHSIEKIQNGGVL